MQAFFDPLTSRRTGRHPLPALFALATVVGLSACGGGGGSNDAPPPTGPDTNAALCPDSIDYSTPYTIGAGSGELAKLQLDTTKLTWTVTFLDSSVPRKTGTVAPTRSDPTGGQNVMTGALLRETVLPTERQNKCSFRLAGASLDPARHASIFIGFGVVGGSLPGARVAFAGHLGAGAVPDTLFPYYQFIGFTDIETDLSKIAGDYNGLGFHVVPTKRFQAVAQDFKMRINADGTFKVCNNVKDSSKEGESKCVDADKQGDPFEVLPNGALRSTNYKGEIQPPSIGGTKGHVYLIVGKLRGQLVPIMIRIGFTNDPTDLDGGNPAADDEIGMGMLAPIKGIQQGSIDGQYIGVDSNFDYRVTALVSDKKAMLDPFHPADASLASAYTLDYSQKGGLGVVAARRTDISPSAPFTGKVTYSGGALGFLDVSQPSKPYFTIGALVQ